MLETCPYAMASVTPIFNQREGADLFLKAFKIIQNSFSHDDLKKQAKSNALYSLSLILCCRYKDCARYYNCKNIPS